MLFSTPIFLFLFLPLVIVLYYLLPRQGKNASLLFFSLLFYTWGELELVFVMLSSVVVDYFASLLIVQGKRRLGLFMSLTVNLGLLCYFKYGNFAYENYQALLELLGQSSDPLADLRRIVQPLGISFYTFQTLSYTLDVYWEKVKPTRNFIDFAAYVTLFPQLIAGPIIRYRDVQFQLKSRQESLAKFAQGTERFIIGLAKKVILADSFGIVGQGAFSMPPEELSMGFAWIGLIAAILQLYFDFAGYSDMAIGMGKMFGFDFIENFNYPYISRSLQEFWRRWHISLSHWFRDYLYFPLRKTTWGRRNIHMCLIILFVSIGFWHGANWTFVVFGLLQAIVIVLERIASRKKWIINWRPLSHFYLIWVLCMSMICFNSASLNQIWEYGQTLYGMGKLGWQGAYPYFNLEMLFLTITAVVLCMPVYPWIQKKFAKLPVNSLGGLLIAYRVFLLFLFVVSVAYISANTYNPFIYFRF